MLTRKERYNLALFTRLAQNRVKKMEYKTKYPSLKVIYSKVLENLKHVPINVYSGNTLFSNREGTVYGENLKNVRNGVLRSAIRIPHDHLFTREGLIRLQGGLTLLHEESHVILPRSAKFFTQRVGLPMRFADELFADLLSGHIAGKMGFKKDVIRRHLEDRRSYFEGFPVDRLATEGIRGVREELREHRGLYRPEKVRARDRELRRRAEKREALKAPKEREHILPLMGGFHGPFKNIGRKKRPFEEHRF